VPPESLRAAREGNEAVLERIRRSGLRPSGDIWETSEPDGEGIRANSNRDGTGVIEHDGQAIQKGNEGNEEGTMSEPAEEGEDKLEPFDITDEAWRYLFLEEYLGKGWTDETTPPPEFGSYSDDPDISAADQKKAWKCKFPHAFGIYIMSGRRNSCAGCEDTKEKAHHSDLAYNICWPNL
jgi:hypothetical protein